MNIGELNATARAMVAKNRGILAADESTSTIKKRFDTIKLESTEENRRAYREMLFTAPGAQEYISGVIMYDETLRQKTKDGVPFPAYLAKAGMLPGIKVDYGGQAVAGISRARPSPKGWMGCASAWPSTTNWARDLPNGAP